MADYHVDIDVNVDDSKLDALESRIKSLNKDNVIKAKVELDDSALKASLNGSKKNNTVIFKADTSNVEKGFASITRFTGKYSAKPMKLDVDTSAAKKEISGLNAVIDRSGISINELKNELKNIGFSDKVISSLTSQLEKANVELSLVQGKFKNDDAFTLKVKGIDEAQRKIETTISMVKRFDKETQSFEWDVNREHLVDLYRNTGNAAKESAAAEREAASATKRAAQEAANAASQRQKLIETYKAEKQAKVDVESKYNKIENPTSELNKFYNEYKNASKNLFDTNKFTDDVAAVKQYTTALETVKNQLSIVSNSEKEAAAEATRLANAIETAATSSTKFRNLDAELKTVKQASKEAVDSVEKLSSAQKELSSAAAAYKSDPSVTNKDALYESEEKFQQQLKKTNALVKENVAAQRQRVVEEKNAATATKQIADAERLRTKAGNLSLSMDVWLEKNSKASDEIKNNIRKLQTQLRDCDSVQLSNLQEQFKTVTLAAEKAGQTGLNFTDRLKMQFTRLAGYFGASSVIMGGIQTFRKMAENVLEVDTQMTELKRVTDLSASQYSNLYDDMIVSAKEYGATLSDIISSTADWSRAGFDADTANGLAEVTMMYEHIADIDYEEATKNLLTTYKGFQSQLDNTYGDTESSVNHIADVLNELDNNYSVTAAGVGEALRRSAASMDVANNSFEQTAALVTGAVEVTQDPEGAGNALKVVSMRLRGAKGELEDLGEEVDDNVTNLTKMQGQILNLTHGRVNIFEDNGDFKSTYEILQGIHDVWDDLNDIEQADLLENVAGKHRANTVASILANWDDVEKAYQSALNSTGSAAKENEKYMDSLQGRLNNLTTVFQSFSNTVVSSDFLKGFVDAGSGALDILDKLISKVGLLPTLLAGVSAALTPKGYGGIFKVVEDDAEQSGKRIATIFGDIKSLINKENIKPIFNKTSNKQLGSDINALRNYKSAISEGMSVSDAFSTHLSSASVHMQEYAKSADSAKLSVREFATAEKQRQVTIKAANTSLSRCRELIDAYNDSSKRNGLSQQQFTDAISKSNTSLSSYLSGLSGAKGNIAGYTASLVAAKAATIALEVATMAMNAAITLGVSMAIQGLVTWISDMIHAEEKLAETVSESTKSYNDQHKSLIDGKSDFKELAESYEKLSSGVDKFTGKNISLMPDEYKEYQDVVNQIAEQVPSLVSGYDAQGNAILNCAGDVDTLMDAYNNLIIAQNDALLNGDGKDYKGLGDILDDFQNDYNELQNSGISGTNNTISTSNTIEDILGLPEINRDELDSYLNSLDDLNEANNTVFSVAGTLSKELENKGINIEKPNGFSGIDAWKDYIVKVCNEYPDVARSVVSNMNVQLDDISQKSHDAMNAFIENAFLKGDYPNINDDMQGMLSSIVDNLDAEAIRAITNGKGGDEGKTLINEWMNNLFTTFNDLSPEIQEKLSSAFSLQTDFSNGEMSFGDYKSKLEEVSKIIDDMNLSDDAKHQLKLSLNIDDVNDQYNTLKNRLTSEDYKIKMSPEIADDFINSLSSSELEAAQELIVNDKVKWEGKTPDEIKAEIQKLSNAIQAMKFSIDIDAETESLDNLNSALAESKTATGLTTDSMDALISRYSSLPGYNMAALFEETANGIRLNTTEYQKLEKEYSQTKLEETNKNLSIMKDRYDYLSDAISNCTDASKMASYITEQNNIRQHINDLAEEAAMYEGLTSKYKAWQDAESAGSDRDMYESVLSGFKDVEDEISRGWLDDASKAFIDMFSSNQLNSIDDYINRWQTLGNTIEGTTYSVKDFFTQDDSGNSTNDGVYNFLDAVDQLGMGNIQRNENGEIISFDFGVDGEKAIADAMGISEELVQIILRASEDAGFTINMDGAYTSLADLKNAAQEAQDELTNLKNSGKIKLDGFSQEDLSFNFSEKTTSGVENQLNKAKNLLNSDEFKVDGKFNIETEGAQEALTIARTLQMQWDNLNKPAYMSIDTSQVDEAIKEPIQELQQFDDLSSQKHLMELAGVDTSEVDKQMDDIVSKLEGLEPEVKTRLGIDGLTTEELKEKLENNKVTIQAELDITAKMDSKLGVLVDQALHDARLIGDEEYEKRLNVYMNANVDDEDAKNEVDGATDNLIEGIDYEDEKTVDINANVNGTQDIRDLSSLMGSLGDEQLQIIANVIGKIDVDSLKSAVEGLDDKTIQAIATALGKGDVQGLQSAIDSIPNESIKQAIAQAFGYDDVEGLKNAIGGMDGKTVQAIAQALGADSVEGLKSVVKSLDGKTVKAIAEAIGSGDVNALKNTISGLQDKTITVTTNVVNRVQNVTENLIEGIDFADGTANVKGTAFARGTTGKAFKKGNWGTQESGTALMGELGQELIVRDGRFFTVGDDGAEFASYKKGDIIFNADQTKELFEKGKVTNGGGRGRSFAEGTAFSSGSGGIGRANKGKSVSSSSSSGSGSSSSSSSNSSSSSGSDANEEAEKFEETINWIEIAIDRVERAISRLDKTASSTYKKWSKRNTALNDQINETRNEIDLQQRAYDRYIQQANSVGLDESYASKVRNGEINIETIDNEDLNDKISEYKEWYEKALDCKDAIDDLRESESQLYEQRFNNIATEYDGYLGLIEHEKNMLEESISQSETRGWIVSKKYYDALTKNANKNINELKKERDSLVSALNTAVDSGTIDEYSESWFNMKSQINEVTEAIKESETAVLDYAKSIRELDWQIFDLIQDKITDVADEAQFLVDLMENKKLYEDNGQLTDIGMATMGQYGVKYNVYMAQADKYAKKIKELQADLAKDPYNQDIQNQIDEYIQSQRDVILNAEEAKNAIKDMVEEGIDKELSALQKLIDKYNDSLDAQKDLFDYQKKVKEQTKEISDLEKQMAAYQGDDSEETKAKIQQIKVDLESAKEDLQETEYDKYISDQQKLLDDLYEEYETILNMRLDDIDALIEDMIAKINEESISIGETIKEQSDNVGYTLSQSMDTIWLSGNKSISSVITNYGDKFDTALTTTNKALGDINTNVQNMITQLNKLADTDIKAAGAPEPTPAPAPTPAPEPEPQPAQQEVAVGSRINAGNATIYATSSGGGAGHQYFSNDPIYDVIGENNGYVLARWYKLSSGYTGWFRKSDVSAYASGVKNLSNNEMAWTQENGAEMIVRPSDGAILTPLAKSDSVLTASASGNIWDMANSPSDFIKDNLDIDNIDANVGSNGYANYTQNLDKVVFNLPNVKNYNELLSEMQKDKNFERLILSMSIDRLAGKSSLAKGKAIR